MNRYNNLKCLYFYKSVSYHWKIMIGEFSAMSSSAISIQPDALSPREVVAARYRRGIKQRQAIPDRITYDGEDLKTLDPSKTYIPQYGLADPADNHPQTSSSCPSPTWRTLAYDSKRDMYTRILETLIKSSTVLEEGQKVAHYHAARHLYLFCTIYQYVVTSTSRARRILTTSRYNIRPSPKIGHGRSQ